MDETARFSLPQLAPGQAQKEWFHNEALQRIDALLCPVVETDPVGAPPSAPVTGTCYLIATGATGAWAGKDGAIAAMTEGGWRFIDPIDGMHLVDRASGEPFLRRDGVWERGVVRAREIQVNGEAVIRQRQPAIADPTGGAMVDSQCRVALIALLDAARAHGLIA